MQVLNNQLPTRPLLRSINPTLFTTPNLDSDLNLTLVDPAVRRPRRLLLDGTT
jgi:hypothetical protein